MGAPNPASRDVVRAAKQDHNEEGEPLNSETRILQNNGPGESITVNVTRYAAKTFRLTDGDEVVVETHADRVVVKPLRGDND